jgi:hypothetical protein
MSWKYDLNGASVRRIQNIWLSFDPGLSSLDAEAVLANRLGPLCVEAHYAFGTK